LRNSPTPRGLIAGPLLALLVAAIAAVSVPGAAAQSRGLSGLDAESAIVVDARDGHVLYRRNAAESLPIASTTKLMTALLSVERLPLKRRLRAAPYAAGAAESQIGLMRGERMSVADLLRALMLESANDAAVTLARGAGGSVPAFVALMNERAQKLGLKDTHYANPVGLDAAGNYSSARDLAALARVVLRNRFLAETADMPNARLLTGSHPRIVDNRNDLVRRVPWIDGVKTGHTSKAGYVLVGAGKRRGAKLVSVVLDTPSDAARDTDTLALLEHGFGFYRRVPVFRPGRAVAQAEVHYFDRKVAVEPARPLAVSVRRGEHVRTRVDAPGEVTGPLDAGARVGRATVYVGGRRVRTIALVTAESVPEAGVVRKLAHWLAWPLTAVAVAALAALAVTRRRRRVAAANEARRQRRQAARLDQPE
jgi:serine-type D-Ala-D-Ala carboxypeptidase (penicillin-binding protein 5/6)